MGCGCRGSAGDAGNGANAMNVINATNDGAKAAAVPTASQFLSSEAGQDGSDSYGGTQACSRCYVKHLAKAAVLASEYAEDRSRYREYVMCVGNIACAEDHASALGLSSEAEELRAIRKSIPDDPVPAVRRLLDKAEAMARRDLETEESLRRGKSVMALMRRIAAGKAEGALEDASNQ